MAVIAIIDDRIVNRNVLARLAQTIDDDIEVVKFGGPVDALGWLEGHQPELIITDFNMPEMDGAIFIESLRKINGCANIPVIVVTIYEDREFCHRALDAGATDFLLSPFDKREFCARVRNLLTMRQQQLELVRRNNELRDSFDHAEAEFSAEIQNTNRRLKSIIDAVPALVTSVDKEGRYLLLNKAARRFHGLDPILPIYDNVKEVLGHDTGMQSLIDDQRVFVSAQPLPGREHTLQNHDGKKRTFITYKSPVQDDEGSVGQVVSVSMDVTEIRASERLRRHEARHDSLTGLYNREAFCDMLASDMRRVRDADTDEKPTIILTVLDLDRFRRINDGFGQGVGDDVLKQIAMRLDHVLPNNSMLARLGGDEFALMYQTEHTDRLEIQSFVRSVQNCFQQPVVIKEGEDPEKIDASIGVSLYPTDGDAESAEQFLQHAELAMYRAKASGRNAYRFYAAEMNIYVRQQINLERDMRRALDRDEFVLHYQPQIDLVAEKVTGVEALVRWRHPRRGIVPPGEFIGLAEDTGLIEHLTEWVLREACRQLHSWLQQGMNAMRMGVNLSPVQFREQGIETIVERVLKETGLPANLLDLELTESAVLNSTDSARNSLDFLQRLGVHLSIDDFGTGYSSLSRVRELPVETLKIDRCFIGKLDRSQEQDESIVRSIVNLSRDLKMDVIAEGVENIAQLRVLQRLKCPGIQGNLISPPVPADHLFAMMQAGGPPIAELV